MSEAPPPMPRTPLVILAEILVEEEKVDNRILLADQARWDAKDAKVESVKKLKYDDCCRWLDEAIVAVRQIKKLRFELELAQRMKLNHD